MAINAIIDLAKQATTSWKNYRTEKGEPLLAEETNTESIQLETLTIKLDPEILTADEKDITIDGVGGALVQQFLDVMPTVLATFQAQVGQGYAAHTFSEADEESTCT